MAEMSDLELLEALGVDAEPKKKSTRSPREERIIAGFEDIQRFFEQHGHPPAHGEDKDIFERIYAVRLDRIRNLPECRDLVKELDHQGLLDGAEDGSEHSVEEMDDAELLSQLGIDNNSENDITQLKYVKSRAEVRAAEEIANRTRCEDIDAFKPLFDAVQQDLETGLRVTRPFRDNADIRQGDWFILCKFKLNSEYLLQEVSNFRSENLLKQLFSSRNLHESYLHIPQSTKACQFLYDVSSSLSNTCERKYRVNGRLC